MKRILIVEDDQEIAQSLGKVLVRNGYDISLTGDGLTGLQKAIDDNPDLVLLDLILPKLSGEEVCKKIRKNKKTEKLPIIMITGKSEDVDRVVGKVIGANYYIIKPYIFEDLLLKISQIL